MTTGNAFSPFVRSARLRASGYLLTPFRHLADGNPYDAYLPPVETLLGQPQPDPVAMCRVWTRRFARQRASRFRIAFGDA
ncbi:MAG: DUF6117 family protein [bacterium]|nr:DUF6117 family protein [bacterium]